MRQPGIVFLCFSLIFSAGWAADPAPPSPTDTYIVARDRYIASFAAHPIGNASDTRNVKALADLGGQLKQIIPTWSAPGFSEGRISLTSLERDIEFGVLDGVVYEKTDTRVVATTPPLLQHWIADHNTWWDGSDNIPLRVGQAIRSEPFWTYAMFDDARALLHGEVPVAVQGGVVLLTAYAQDDIGDAGPNVLVAATIQGDRAFVARQKLLVPTRPNPVCQAALKQMLARSKASYAAYQASKLKDKASFDISVRYEEQADRDYRACFAAHLRDQPHYKAIVRQAQALVDLLH
jgi:hypothetical protein